LIEIINKPLLLHLVGYLYYWQMGFNSVFKGLSDKNIMTRIKFKFTILSNLINYIECHESHDI